MDISKEVGIILDHLNSLEYECEVIGLEKEDPCLLLNSVYRDISEKMGMETAMEMYQMFRGQQITFPVRFFDPGQLHCIIAREYDGTNLKQLAIKYGYSEKTIRRIIKSKKE